MDFEATAMGTVTAERMLPVNKNRLDDFLYLVMGEASIANLVVMIFVIAFFAATPVAMLLLFGAYSGGMRWLITLGMVATLGAVAIYLMKRGVEGRHHRAASKAPQTEFKGQLTGLTEAAERATAGYAYSQQMLRERLCEDILNKLGLARDLGPDEMAAMLESRDTGFVGDEVLAKFLLENRRGVKGWEDTQVQTKGKSAERGRKFMMEMDDILRRTEAIV